jgi:transposase
MQPTPEIQHEITQCSPALQQYLAELQAENECLTQQVAELQARLNQNCTNSNQPPSSSPFIKPKSLRVKTGRKPGGQPGHKGHNLPVTVIADEVIEHKVDICGHCGGDLSQVITTVSQTRQVVDVKIVRVVTQHSVQSKTCPMCGQQTTAEFPPGLDHYLQYGNTYKSLMVYLNQGNYLPYDRLARISKEVLDIPVSPGTLVNIVHKCGWALKPSLAYIKDQLIQSKVAHFDETGSRVKGKNQWLHSAGNEQFTYLATHPRRGSAATQAIGILPNFSGTAIHDFWKSYYHYGNCKHGLCNAHILRELQGIEENYHQTWAVNMQDLLLEIKQSIEDSLGVITLDEYENFEKRYEAILRSGEKENSLNMGRPVAPKALTLSGQRGRRAHTKARNLLDRLWHYGPDVLRFMEDTAVPFDNNLAERDIRMSKVQQKISGGFRSEEGSASSNRIRSYISTATKQRISVLKALQAVFSGKPLFTAENP